MAPSNLVQSVTRAAQILDTLAAADGPLSTAQIAARLKLARPTVHRLLDTLFQVGAIARDQGLNAPGPALLRWAESYAGQSLLLPAAPPVVDGLRDATGETAYLFVRQGRTRICICKADGTQALRRFVEVGMTLPLHAGSAGKALLSGLDEARLRTLLGDQLTTFTAHTLVDPARLAADLRAIREAGTAVSLAEREEGLASISAPVVGPDGQVQAAVGISGPLGRFSPERVPVWRHHVRAAADRLEEALGVPEGHPGVGPLAEEAAAATPAGTAVAQ